MKVLTKAISVPLTVVLCISKQSVRMRIPKGKNTITYKGC